jgi:hypothetical protein
MMTLFSELFLFFWASKTHFRIGKHENKEKRFFYVVLRILLSIQKFSRLKLKIKKNRLLLTCF